MQFPDPNYAHYSYWLETCGDDLTPRPRLDGSTSVDVAVMGAGYTGLWTAYYLLQRDPSLKVAVIEREIAGFGASGRNGGWCYPGFPVSGTVLRERYGLDAARAVSAAMYDTFAEIERVIDAEGIDAQWQRGGTLRLARGEGRARQRDHRRNRAVGGNPARQSRYPTRGRAKWLRRQARLGSPGRPLRRRRKWELAGGPPWPPSTR